MSKKIKEINFNPSIDQPNYPGYKTKIYNGYSGGMINNADSSYSRRMQIVMDEDENEEEFEEEEEMILNKRKTKDGKFSLLETLEGLLEEVKEEFHELDLEEDIDEQITASGSGIQGYSGPLGREKEKNISQAEYLQKEQIERMRILEAYHQKTTNKLK